MATQPIGIGIDLGVNGAVAVLDGDSVTVQPLPLLEDRTLDVRLLGRLLFTAVNGLPLPTVVWEGGPFRYGTNPPQQPPARTHCVVFEAVFRPNSLVRLGGEVSAVCKAEQCEHAEVPVVLWKKAVLGSNSSDKQLVIDWCKRTYPAVSLRRSPRARTDSHDFADAIALGHYARGLLSGNYL